MELWQISLREICTARTVIWHIQCCYNSGALVLKLKNKYMHFSYFYLFMLLFYFLFFSQHQGRLETFVFPKRKTHCLLSHDSKK